MSAIGYDDTRRAETRAQLHKALRDHLGMGPEHITLDYNTWNLSTWHEDEMLYLQNEPNQILNYLDKLWIEIANTDRNTTIKPIETSLALGLPREKTVKIHYNSIYNIITTSGLVEIGARGTAEADTTTGVTHGAVGIGTTAEALADVALETEEDRKEFDTDGVRAMSGTTERYGLAFSRSDFSADKEISEAGLLTKVSGGHLVARVVATPVTVSTGRIMTMQVDITHVNGTEV